ncbi:MAG: hypothetical protein AAB263_07540, partial [Planctomycetota bacterium]
MALITAIWMTVIGIMLVTTLATLITGNIGLAASIGADAKARIAAHSGVEKAIAYLIADRPSGLLDTPGVIITEVQNRPQDYIRDLLPLHSTSIGAGGNTFDTSFEFCGNDTLWIKGGGTLLDASLETYVASTGGIDAVTGAKVFNFKAMTATFATDGSGSNRWLRSCTVAVSPNDTVNFGCWYYTAGISDHQMRLILQWRDAQGTVIGSVTKDFDLDTHGAWRK